MKIFITKGEAGEGDALTPKELDNLASSIKEYVHNCDKEAILNIGKLTLTKIKTAFGIFKSLVSYSNGRDAIIAGSDSFPDLKVDSSDEVAALKSCLLQRDNEIAILVNMIKKGKTIDDVSIARVRSAESNEEIISVGVNDGECSIEFGVVAFHDVRDIHEHRLVVDHVLGSLGDFRERRSLVRLSENADGGTS